MMPHLVFTPCNLIQRNDPPRPDVKFLRSRDSQPRPGMDAMSLVFDSPAHQLQASAFSRFWVGRPT